MRHLVPKHDWPLLPALTLLSYYSMSMILSCAGMDPRGRGGPPMGMAQPGRGGGRGPGATVEGDRWGKRALPPPPPGTGGPAMSNLPALHKTDNKFKVRCVPSPYCSCSSGLHRSLCLQCRHRHHLHGQGYHLFLCKHVRIACSNLLHVIHLRQIEDLAVIRLQRVGKMPGSEHAAVSLSVLLNVLSSGSDGLRGHLAS